MPRYALLLGGADLDKRSGNPEYAAKIYDQFISWMKWVEESGKGKIVTPHKLRDHSGARLSVRGGQVVEGPFMETKEAVGGVAFVDADSLEEAVAIARRCPTLQLQNGFIEVRVVEGVRRPESA